jgi:hypothetical protein
VKLVRAALVEAPMLLHSSRPWLLRIALAALIGASIAGAGVLALAEPPKAGHAPDPAGRADRKQWIFDITHKGGKNTITRVRPVTLEQPVGSARVMGRYAVELYVGKQLLDRVRFNVPLTGDGPAERSHRRVFSRPTFENVSTRLRVQITDQPRAAYVVLVDRATGDTQRFWWPPSSDGTLVPMATPPGAAADAAAPDAAAPETTTPEPERSSSAKPGPAAGVDAGAPTGQAPDAAARANRPADRAAPPASKSPSKPPSK